MTATRGAMVALAALALCGCDDSQPRGSHPPLLAFARTSCDEDRDCGIFVVRPDGTGLRRVSPNEVYDDPAWSPDGKRLAYVLPNNKLYVLEYESGRRKLLSSSLERGTAWSPDGRLIAGLAPTGSPNIPDYAAVIPAEGGDAERIGPEEPRAPEDPVIVLPAWSPDSRRIAYTAFSVRPIRVEPPPNPGIYTMRLDGSEQRRVTNSGDATDWDLRWTRDGRVFFVRQSGELDGLGTLFSVWPDGSSLTPWQAAVAEYDVSPDGRHVAWARNTAIYVASRPGESRLLARPTDPSSLRWSPDGDWLAFIAPRGDDELIFVVETQSGSVKQLSPSGGRDEDPVWRPAP